MITIVPQPKKLLESEEKKKIFVRDFGFSGNVADIFRTEEESFRNLTGLKDKKNIKVNVTNKKGYTLTVGEKKITIEGESEEAVFWGIQTLKQLLFKGLKEDKGAEVPICVIEDYPNYNHRGYMLDVVRHFFPIDELYKIVDILALTKINRFHLHLCDDQGWRVEIKQYPLLTEKASVREQTLGDGTPYGGFYTQEELKELVEYAKGKFVEIIPEFDLPGHFSAVLSVYPQLGCSGQKTEVATNFGIFEDIACGGKEETYTFIENVINEMADIFPSPFFHIGGDEAPKIRWVNCPCCQGKVKELGLKSVEELQGYMTNRVITHLKKLGKKAVVWNESLNSGILDNDAIVQYWNDGKKAINVTKASEEGREIIVSECNPFYLDYPHGMHSLKAIYNYNRPSLNSANIIGYESPLWCEWVKDRDRVEFLSFPRAFATASLGWGRVLSFKDFEKSVNEFLPMVKAMGIKSATTKQGTPDRIKGFCETLSFLGNFLNPYSIESLKRAIRTAKQMKKQREEKAKHN